MFYCSLVLLLDMQKTNELNGSGYTVCLNLALGLICITHHQHQTTTVLRPFFRDHPGQPVPEENFWTLWCKGRLTEADTQTIRLGTTLSGLTIAHFHPPFFYRPDALPVAQPTSVKALKALYNDVQMRGSHFLLHTSVL